MPVFSKYDRNLSPLIQTDLVMAWDSIISYLRLALVTKSIERVLATGEFAGLTTEGDNPRYVGPFFSQNSNGKRPSFVVVAALFCQTRWNFLRDLISSLPRQFDHVKNTTLYKFWKGSIKMCPPTDLLLPLPAPVLRYGYILIWGLMLLHCFIIWRFPMLFRSLSTYHKIFLQKHENFEF